ncbi:MAG: type IV pilin N-terminal domain-containing protein, partial [Methanomicrobiales archaeon]
MKRDPKIPDDAVSPVIGVMLMLVVTIIIAAVVSAFAGGMADTGKKAPTA